MGSASLRKRRKGLSRVTMATLEHLKTTSMH
jgi:hypothetical protein